MYERRPLALAGLVAALLAGCGSGGDDRAEPQPPREPDVVTVVQDDAELLHRPEPRIAATLDDLRSLGVDWIRITAGWSAIEREPGRYDWSALDRAIAMARERGFGLNIDIAFWAPSWAVSEPIEGSDRQRRGIDAQLFGRFARAVAQRYPNAAAFTIWNEPNHASFLLPQWERHGGELVAAAPHDYREMLRAAVPEVERAAPDALVLIGATSSLGTDDPDDPGDRIAPMTFARELACVDEQLEPLDRPECEDFQPLPGDGWSHHPYPVGLRPWESDSDPDTVRIGDLPRLERLLAALAERGRTQRRLPIYITEFGYQTDPPDPTQPWTPDEQARMLTEGELAARARPTVRAFAQFLVRDLPERPGDTPRERWRDFQSGLRFADGEAKPAHAAFAVGLVAVRAAAGRVRFWGIVRPGSGAHQVRILAGGEPIARLRTREDGTFERELAADPAASFRLQARIDDRWLSGAVLPGARSP